MTLNVGVIGAGAMGTALSQTISENADQILVHARNQDLCHDINNTGYNTHYYPNHRLHENIKATTDLKDLPPAASDSWAPALTAAPEPTPPLPI